jgi:hypothetical protein
MKGIKPISMADLIAFSLFREIVGQFGGGAIIYFLYYYLISALFINYLILIATNR